MTKFFFKMTFLSASLLIFSAPSAKATNARIEQFSQMYLARNNIPTVANGANLDKQILSNRNFVFESKPHNTIGTSYVILTDFADSSHLLALSKLQKHHRGTIIRIPNFAQLENNPAAIESLIKKLQEAKPRYVAIAPRPENYRENVLLTLWSVFARLDQSGQISVFPGWLNAPDDASFSRLIDRSISQQTLTSKSMHPMIVAQVPGPQAGGTRSVAKAALLQRYFEQLGVAAPGFILKTSAAIQAGIQTPMFDAQKAVLNLDAGFLTEIPNVQRQQLSNANLVLLFGHGITGMTCSIDVDAFRTVSFDNKVVLCGSCFSASPDHSDFNSEPENVDDRPNSNGARHAKESFAKRAVANGAKLFYGQMNTNGGFPELYVVLSNLLQGETAGESYQRLLNNRIQASGLRPEQFALRDKTTSTAHEKGQRSELLYVLIGDPALIPIDLQR